MNTRNSKSSNACFDASGTPICPQSGDKFQFLGKSGGENRSLRFKWVCPKSVPIPKMGSRVCTCDTPCTDSTYGKCVYTYPDKDFRLYPGVPRDTEHWDHIYKHRVTVERTINLLKDTFALADNRSYGFLFYHYGSMTVLDFFRKLLLHSLLQSSYLAVCCTLRKAH